jgi:hypothetical protein
MCWCGDHQCIYIYLFCIKVHGLIVFDNVLVHEVNLFPSVYGSYEIHCVK